MSWPWRIEKAIASLLGAPGETETSLRQAVFDRVRLGTGEVPEDPRALVEKIADCPWSVSDEDITRLREAGYSEDKIYELVLAAATGAGVRRFEAGLRAIEGAR
jgi:alkylhydroperoxidase family enzyme